MRQARTTGTDASLFTCATFGVVMRVFSSQKLCHQTTCQWSVLPVHHSWHSHKCTAQAATAALPAAHCGLKFAAACARYGAVSSFWDHHSGSHQAILAEAPPAPPAAAPAAGSTVVASYSDARAVMIVMSSGRPPRVHSTSFAAGQEDDAATAGWCACSTAGTLRYKRYDSLLFALTLRQACKGTIPHAIQRVLAGLQTNATTRREG